MTRETVSRCGIAKQMISLRSNMIFSLVGNLLYSISQCVILVVVCRLGSPQDIGLFAWLQAIATPVFVLANLHLKMVQATDIRRDFHFVDFLGFRGLTTACACFVLFLAGGVSPPLIALALIKILDGLCDLLYGQLQLEEKSRAIATSLAARGWIGSLAFSLSYLIHRDLLMAIILQGTASLACFFLLDFRRIASYLKPGGLSRSWSQRLEITWSIFRLAIPSGLVLASISWTGSIPRLVLASAGNDLMLGEYTAISYFVVIGNPLMLSLNQPALPRLAKLHAAQNGYAFNRLLFLLIAGNALIGLAAWMGAVYCGGALLKLILGERFSHLGSAVSIIMLGAALRYVAIPLIVSARAKRTVWRIAGLHLVEVGVVWFLAASLIPRYGIHGAAWAAVGAAVFELVALSAMSLIVSRNWASHGLTKPQLTSRRDKVSAARPTMELEESLGSANAPYETWTGYAVR